MKIGILGGSFNPAHAGHLHISEIARKKLGLTQVWWLVSPQNPLKPKSKMASFNERFSSAKKIVGRNNKIKVLDLEQKLNTHYTSDTLTRLRQKYPRYEFYWLMGADNLLQLPKWKKWEKILELASVHVFDRDKYFYKAVKSVCYIRSNRKIHYHVIKKNPLSSSFIRKTKNLNI